MGPAAARGKIPEAKPTPDGLAADELFAVLAYAVARAKAPRIHRALLATAQFGVQSADRDVCAGGEFLYCFTTVQGCVAWLCSLERDGARFSAPAGLPEAEEALAEIMAAEMFEQADGEDADSLRRLQDFVDFQRAREDVLDAVM